MKYLPKDTLAYLLQHPAFRPTDLSTASVPEVAKQVERFMDSHQMVKPETSALTFYCMNHIVGLIRQKFGEHEPLPLWAHKIVVDYTNWLSDESKRMFSYLLLITTRESRHMAPMGGAWETQFKMAHGAAAWNFHIATRGHGSSQTVDRFINHPPTCHLNQHVGGHVRIFNTGEFGSKSFGGPKWGAISETLLRAIEGETSLEVMVDTAYTLAHNGGPIFNKGILYHTYSPSLITILDVQRAGQIPRLIRSGMFSGFNVPAFVHEAINSAQTHLEDIPFEVDWHAVVKAGAVGNYASKMKMQAADPALKGVKKQVMIMAGTSKHGPQIVHTVGREALKKAA